MTPTSEHLRWAKRQAEIRYGDLQGNAFQDEFAALMERSEPGFIRIVPWPPVGDLKCDGYITTSKTVFQCYAPRALTIPKTRAKLTSDFSGALTHWAAHIETWVFVHNESGLAAPLVQHLAKLAKQGQALGVTVQAWGIGMLCQRIERLDAPDLRALFGDPPGETPLYELSLSEVSSVLQEIAAQLDSTQLPQHSDLRPPPEEKLRINHLSAWAQDDIRHSLGRSMLVSSALNTLPERGAVERIAAWFREQYSGLVDTRRYRPDEIYEIMVKRVAGHLHQRPAVHRAASVVVAYFFETCDIFERVSVEETDGV